MTHLAEDQRAGLDRLPVRNSGRTILVEGRVDGEPRFGSVTIVVFEQNGLVGSLLIHVIPLCVGVMPADEEIALAVGTLQRDFYEVLLGVYGGIVDESEREASGRIVDGAPEI